MLGKLIAFALIGIEAVSVDVDVAAGFPMTIIVVRPFPDASGGLPCPLIASS
jgi:hypothetical protein